MKALERLCCWLLKRPRSVLAAWFSVAAVAAFFAILLIDSCSFAFQPIPGTPSYEAQQRLGQDFPRMQNSDVEVVLISCRESCRSVAEVAFARRAAQALSSKCEELDRRNPNLITNWTDHFQFMQSGTARLQSSKSPYLSASNQSLLWEVTWQVEPSRQTELRHMLWELQDVANDLDVQGSPGSELSAEPAIHVSLTGSLALFDETIESTKHDVETRDAFILPWALLVLLYRIRSLKLLLIPGFCLAFTIAISFTLLLPFAYFGVVSISPFCPTVMLFLSLACSIDYSLFLLTRFVEEMQAGAEVESALKTMLAQSGHVVTVSGSVLIICYCGVLLFPSQQISTVGFGAALAIFICLATNLTITPCAIAVFPKFFTPASSASAVSCRSLCARLRGRSPDTPRSPSASDALPPLPAAAPFPPQLRPTARARSLSFGCCSMRRMRSDSGSSVGSLELKEPMTSPREGCEAPTAASSTASSQAHLARVEEGSRDEPPPIPRRHCWFVIADLVTKWPGSIMIPIIMIGLMIPPVTQVFNYKESYANSLSFPRHGQASDAYQLMCKEFPAGQLAPVYMLQPTGYETSSLRDVFAAMQLGYGRPASLPSPSMAQPVFHLPQLSAKLLSEASGAPHAHMLSVLSTLPPSFDAVLAKHFEDLCALSVRLLEKLSIQPFGVKPEHLVGIATYPAASMGGDLGCLHWNSTDLDALHHLPISAKMLLAMDDELGESYRLMWSKFMSENGASSMLLLNPPFDPYGEVLRPFINAARAALVSTRKDVESAMLLSSQGIIVDIVEVTYKRFPFILAGTIVLVFTIVAVAFKAAFAPLKMFFTVILPLSAVFGVAIWLYQEKGLDFLGVQALTSPPGAGFYWGTPIFTLTVTIGLALDYDVFLFARVVELRQAGFNNNSSVRGAIILTGPIITSAGLIMAIALGGLLLCDVPSNNQIGFILCFGVLVDTFIIRTCLVPAVLSLGQGLNYWPQKLPHPDKSDEDLARLFVDRRTVE